MYTLLTVFRFIYIIFLCLPSSIAISRSKDVPIFGPPIPDGALFSKGPEFAEFLLIKGTTEDYSNKRRQKLLTTLCTYVSLSEY